MGANTAQKAILTVGDSLAEQHQRRTALSNDGWSAVVADSPIGIAVADLTGRFLAANAAYQKILGYTEQELRELPFFGLTFENDRGTVQELLEGKRQQFQIEKRFERKDGSSVWIRSHVSLLPKTEKISRCLMAIVEDITERRQAEQQVQAKKTSLEELFEQSPGAVALLDRDHRVVGVNKEFTRLFGYLQEEAVGRELIDLTVPTELPEEVQRYHDLINRQERVEAEAIRRRKDGTLLHVSILGMGVSTGCGSVATYAIYQDITQRKRLEEKIKENERELRLQTEVIPQHIWSALPDGSVDYSNQSLRGYLGLTMEEMRLVGTNFIHPDDRDRVLTAWEEATSQGTTYEVEARQCGRDGQYRWFLIRALPLRDTDGHIIKWYGTNTDIEDRKQAEERLRAAMSERTRLLAVRAEIGMALARKDNLRGILHTCAEAVVRHLEVAFARIWTLNSDSQELELQASAGMYTHLDGRHSRIPVGALKIGLIAQERKALVTSDVQNDSRISDQDWARNEEITSFAGHPLLVEDRVVGVIGMFSRKRITQDTQDAEALAAAVAQCIERKRLEEKVSANERELQLQTEVIPQHIWSASPDGSIDYCNQRLLTYLGQTMEEMKVAGVSFIHPDDRNRLLTAWHDATSRGTAYEVEARLLGRDGQYRWFLERALPLRDAQGQIIKWYGTNTDIEDRKRVESELHRSQAYLEEGQRLSHTGSWAWSASSEETYWSQETFRIFGFDPANTKPSFEMFLERIHPEDRPKFDQECKGVTNEKKDGELDFRIVLPDGSIKYVHDVGHSVIDESGLVTERFGVCVDMTEQVQARAALQKAYEEINRLKDQLYKENLALREEIDQASMFEEIVGSSAALQRVLANVAKVAPTDSTVLVTGETGTGKELIARAIHKRSHRSERAFVKVNCAALPASLIGSELFGHEKGAFTGALQRRLGRFELAEGGSIFLDEIGDLPPETQIALLRVLQEREFERIGGSEAIAADVRIIAATHRDLKAAVAAGTFRGDLFYRFNVFPIEVPPLRERLEDIPLLVEYFIGRYASRAGKKIRNIHKKTLEQFQSYLWPGNLRELQNVIERSVILCESETLLVDLSWLTKEFDPTPEVSRSLTERLMDQEKEIIESALAASRGRVAGMSGAAVKVGMPASTLEARIKALKIDKKQFTVA